MKKIVITGATGFIGKKIINELIQRGDEITIFTRTIEKANEQIPGLHDYVKWDIYSSDWYSKLNGKDAVIHLAGENVMSRRWSEEHKKNILSSRIDSTQALVKAIARLQFKPKIFVSASAVGYYGNSEEAVDENSKQGNDFLAGVVKLWEDESKKVEQYGVRRVNVRTGIVLDKNEGALSKMLTPFKLFIGGPIGNGKQWFPWIHIDDVVGIYLFALDDNNVSGVLNAVSPNPVRMKEFCEILGRILHRPSSFSVPVFILRIIFGEGAETILSGAKVIPGRLTEYGYKFRFENAEEALKSLLQY